MLTWLENVGYARDVGDQIAKARCDSHLPALPGSDDAAFRGGLPALQVGGMPGLHH